MKAMMLGKRSGFLWGPGNFSGVNSLLNVVVAKFAAATNPPAFEHFAEVVLTNLLHPDEGFVVKAKNTTLPKNPWDVEFWVSSYHLF